MGCTATSAWAQAGRVSPKSSVTGNYGKVTVPMEEHASRIIFPTVQFQDATLLEVVEFLRVKSRDLDPAKKGLNFVLTNPAAAKNIRITVNLTNVPLTEALREIADRADKSVCYDAYAVLIAPPEPIARPVLRPAGQPLLWRRAESIVLPRASFAGATLQQVLEFLRAKSQEIDPGEKRHQHPRPAFSRPACDHRQPRPLGHSPR